jgi:hypothetical protein
MAKFNNLIHKEFSAFGKAQMITSGEISNVHESIKEMECNIVQQLQNIDNTLKCQERPICPPNPGCFAILFSAYTIGTWFLGGEGRFDLKECNERLRAYSKCEEYKHCIDLLKEQQTLAYQYSQLAKPLQKASFDYRAARINDLNAFIFGVIIWCQTSQGGYDGQEQSAK